VAELEEALAAVRDDDHAGIDRAVLRVAERYGGARGGRVRLDEAGKPGDGG
jgi:hypothetical protein